MTDPYYLYMLHESPIQKPYYCKIGITNNPLERLRQLQSGNPRTLRAWDYERRPNQNFGFILPNREMAEKLEKKLLRYFDTIDVRLRQDFNYQQNTASKREWIEGIEPKELWELIVKAYADFLKENNLLRNL